MSASKDTKRGTWKVYMRCIEINILVIMSIVIPDKLQHEMY